MNKLIVAIRVRGNKQYPSKQILWKKVIVPPSNWPFNEITAPPNQTITKTISNNNVLSSALVPVDSTLQLKKDYVRQGKYDLLTLRE